MKVLELFSGTGSVNKICKKLNWEVTSLDLKNADINIDILKWDYKTLAPKTFDIIWASPPCNTFSQLQYGRRTEAERIDNINKNGLPILNKTLEIIDYFQPKYYFIENPQTGTMKDYLNRPFYDVDYCRYSNWGYRKRTRVWTNKENFTPLMCNKNCGNGVIVNKKYRHNKDLSIDYHTNDRYRIPPSLISELFENL
jgi:hypothetical protein